LLTRSRQIRVIVGTVAREGRGKVKQQKAQSGKQKATPRFQGAGGPHGEAAHLARRFESEPRGFTRIVGDDLELAGRRLDIAVKPPFTRARLGFDWYSLARRQVDKLQRKIRPAQVSGHWNLQPGEAAFLNGQTLKAALSRAKRGA
jgi:hypothetical protein